MFEADENEGTRKPKCSCSKVRSTMQQSPTPARPKCVRAGGGMEIKYPPAPRTHQYRENRRKKDCLRGAVLKAHGSARRAATDCAAQHRPIRPKVLSWDGR